MISEQGAKLLMAEPAARDFAADAFAHMKFIGHTPASTALV
jgi:catalase